MPQLLQPKLSHSPTLDTVQMVEDTIQEAKEVISLAELKRRLPRKVNHNTLKVILTYLQRSGKIEFTPYGIVWILVQDISAILHMDNCAKQVTGGAIIHPDNFAKSCNSKLHKFWNCLYAICYSSESPNCSVLKEIRYNKISEIIDNNSINDKLKKTLGQKGTITKEEIVSKLEENRTYLRSIGVKKLTLIGSYARGEATDKSDIDLLVEFEIGRGLCDDYMCLLHFLQDLFDKEVDLAEASLLRDELKSDILEGARIECQNSTYLR